MKQYLQLLRKVLCEGDPQYNARTGQLMIVSSGEQSTYNLQEGFPICTTKPVSMRWVAEEVFWILRGERSARPLYQRGVDIWNKNAFQHYLKRNGLESKISKNTPEWNNAFLAYQERMNNDPSFSDDDADLGPVYGYQLRHWPAGDGAFIDQLARVVEGLKKDKGSRYHLFSMWNPADLDKMALGPCHIIAHFTVTRDSELDLHMFQRSCDMYLGVPFNIVQYSLINHLIAHETGLHPRKLIHTYSNVHAYCGVPPRSDFVRNNLDEFQAKVRSAQKEWQYSEVLAWYLNNAPPESAGNERKDHIPFILEQLSKTPKRLPRITIEKMPLFEIITRPAKEVIALEGYEPLKWNSKAVMAA